MRKYSYSPTLKRLQTEKRIPYLFIGAGFTRRYITDSFKWEELLDELAKIIGIDSFIITNLRNKYAKNDTVGVVNQKIASFLSNKLSDKIISGDYEHIFTAEDINCIEVNKYDAFKYLVSKTVSIKKNIAEFKYEKEKYKYTELKHFKMLRKNIPAIFTTNYDQLIEMLFCNEYITFNKQADYFYTDNFNYAEIYKIHGSVDDPNSIVITKEDYDDFEKKNFLTISKLLQVLSSNPIIFIGYSMQDEDINNIMKNLISCIDNDKLKILENNLIFVSWKPQIRNFIESTKEFQFGNKTVNLRVIETDNFTNLFVELTHFGNYASPSEIRKYKSIITNLINTNQKKLTYIFANLDNEELPFDEDKKIISAVASSTKSSQKYTRIDIVNNYLKARTKFSSEEMLMWSSDNFNCSWWVPLYAYLDVYKVPTLKKFCEKKTKQIENLKERLKKVKCVSTIEEIKTDNLKEVDQLKVLCKSLIELTVKSADAKKYLKDIYNQNPKVKAIPEFVVCVTLVSKNEYDAKKNKANK